MLLILADNQAITRLGVSCLALSCGIFTEIKEASTRENLVKLLNEYPEAVVVLDYTQFNTSPEQLIILQERFKGVHWILFSEHLTELFIRRMAFSSLSFSIVLKDSPLEEIKSALYLAGEHTQYICEQLAQWLFKKEIKKKKESSGTLTVTEQEILKAIALGKTTKEIAAQRFLSVHTVMTHRKNIFRKLEINNIHEATKYALKAGIVDTIEYSI